MLHSSLHSEMSASPRLLIGTGGRGSRGIYTATFAEGRLDGLTLAVEAMNPSFLAVPSSPGGRLVAVTQPEDKDSHASCFVLPAERSGSAVAGISLLAEASSGSPGGCHISTTRDGGCVFLANYGGGSVASFALAHDGSLKLGSLVRYPASGHGPDADRQKQSYVHSARPSPDDRYLLVNDLGLDHIHILRIDPHTAMLTPHGAYASLPGSGPRHLAYHANGRWIYCINELSSTIDQLLWDAAAGTLQHLSTARTLPDDVDPHGKRACEMVISRDRRFLYASNRVNESFTVFALDAATGALSPIQHLPHQGHESRHVTLDPSGRWFLTANQFSDDIAVYPIHQQTGMLGERASTTHLGAPTCLLFA